jgi:glycerol-3-phosphate dehydrogenase (NAD(P)+)
VNRVAVIGAGAWGTALAAQAHRAGAAVTLWARDPARAGQRLPGALSSGVTVTADLPGDGFDAILLVIPVQHLREVASRLRPRAPVVVCAKGIEAGSLALPLEIVAELHPGVPGAVLTGPNFAHEIAAGLPAASVVAAVDDALRTRLMALLASPAFRLYGNDDPVGAQLGGAAKNVIAIAAGAVMGAGLGENARAALVTRGLAELGRFVTALGGRAETVHGLSGLGDLLLTCTGGSSRNYRCGFALGRGERLEAIVRNSAGVIEGIATAPALLARAREVELPICAAVAALLEGRLTVEAAIATLLTRPMRDE